MTHPAFFSSPFAHRPADGLSRAAAVALLALGFSAGCSESTTSPVSCTVVPLEDTGTCDALFSGFWFDGSACVEASASGCDAPDGLHATLERCESEHAACLAQRDCMMPSLAPPGPGDTCLAYFEGFAFVDGACVPMGTSGCAWPRGLFETDAACRQAYAACLPRPQDCAPVTLQAIGACEPAYTGFRWDGTDCVEALGTGCEWPVGLYDTRATCLEQYRSCPGATAACEVPPEPAPEGCDAIFNGWRFTGSGCEPTTFGGCGLPDTYFETEAACRDTYGHCWSAPQATGGCIISGCSAEICSDQALGSNCAWRPEFACFQAPGARCERQDSGACGWTPTSTLQACLASAGAEGA